ncbi:hypothetical protein BKA80DRAFT_278948 [Phyllosticta citrichinensis]
MPFTAPLRPLPKTPHKQTPNKLHNNAKQPPLPMPRQWSCRAFVPPPLASFIQWPCKQTALPCRLV